MQPGDVLERRIELISTLEEDLDAPLYVVGASIEDGSFRPAGPEEEHESPLTSWTSVSPSPLAVPAGGRAMATVRIEVPADAPNGEQYGAVFAELPAGSGDVQVVNRVGVRIYLSVGTGTEPESDFRIDTLRASRDEGGAPIVSAKVTNTGGRALDFRGDLHLLDGPGGVTAGPFVADPGSTLGVGDSTEVVVFLDPEIPVGPWLARITLRSGELERSAEATIMFPEEAGTTSDPVEATPIFRDRGFLVPLALGLLILALFLVFLVWWLKRRRDDEEDEVEGAGQEHVAAVAEE